MRRLRLAALLLAATLTADCATTDDPNLWLEEVEGQAPLAWASQHSKQALTELTGKSGFRELETRLRAILDSPQRIPSVSKRGDYLYAFWRDGAHPRGVWRRTTLAEFRKPEPSWEPLLDLDELAAREKENWVWSGSRCLPPDYDRCLISLSRGGGDAVVVREFTLRDKSFVADGFVLPEAKSSFAWRDRDSIYVGIDTGPGSLTDSGYPRIVREWKRGTPLASAPIVFEGEKGDVSISAARDLTPGFERDFVYRRPTFFSSQAYLRSGDQLTRIEKPDDALLNVHREWLFLQLRSDWTLGGRTHRAGTLLAARFADWMAGDRSVEVLFEPTAQRSLSDLSATRNHLILNELDDVHSRIEVLTHGANGWQRAPLAELPALATAGASPAEPDETDEYFLTLTDFTTPTQLLFGRIGGGAPEKLKQLPAFFDARGLQVEQHRARSADGTSVPYFQISREGLTASGDHATLLYGYGGFEVSLLPAYSAEVGTAWLERGGVYVVANIRGGGEFGPAWHTAALKENRGRAYDDFIAVAEDLIRRGVTRPAKLGIRGGSNGGLLVGNALTRRPDLFGAVVCQVPLLDMRRYHKLLAGASWMGEYGNPDDPAQWAFIRTFSPYQNVRQDVQYPRVLFMTSTRDDRVHPGHARKMVARMEAQGHDVLYYENSEGGHGMAADHAQSALMSSLAYRFLAQQLGLEEGNELPAAGAAPSSRD